MTIPIARHPALCATGLALALVLAAPLAHAQYKVVHPDGSVSYTDRPPVTSNVRVTPMSRPGTRALASPETNLPAELRSAVSRHPVTLYTSAECGPCDTGRRLLQQRGVPYTERRVLNEDDAAALERLLGGRTVPSLTIGAQPLRGFSEADWSAFLDAAGYPRENRLPRGWQQAEATPLAERSAPVAPAPAAPAPAPAPAPVVPPPAPGSIRF
jgi:glutaredoxin